MKIKKKKRAAPAQSTRRNFAQEARDAALQNVRAEFTRLTHTLDEAKANASAEELDIFCHVLRAAYTIFDARITAPKGRN